MRDIKTLAHCSFAIFLVNVFSCTSLANGGPVARTGTTAMGNLVLKQNSAVHLSVEDLKIRLLDDLDSYEVEARYVLANSESNQTILFGVPITWFPVDADQEETHPDLRKAASKI